MKIYELMLNNFDFKKNYDNCIFIVVHKAVEQFAYSAFLSLAEQTVKKFDIVCIWESDNYILLKDIYDLFNGRLFVFNSKNNNIAQNRELGLSIILNAGYKKIILADADDIFSNLRIEVSLDYLKTYDIIVNDFNIIGGYDNEFYLSNRLSNNQIIEYKNIIDCNFLGFSNTALKSDIITNIRFDEKLKVVDWYFYSQILSKGTKAIFTNNALTNYRIWGNNLLNNHLNEEKIKNIVNIKQLHFELLRGYNINVEKYYNFYYKLKQTIDSNNTNLQKQIYDFYSIKYNNQKYHFWLEEVVLDEAIESIINK